MCCAWEIMTLHRMFLMCNVLDVRSCTHWPLRGTQGQFHNSICTDLNMFHWECGLCKREFKIKHSLYEIARFVLWQWPYSKSNILSVIRNHRIRSVTMDLQGIKYSHSSKKSSASFYGDGPIENQIFLQSYEIIRFVLWQFPYGKSNNLSVI